MSGKKIIDSSQPLALSLNEPVFSTEGLPTARVLP